MNRKIAFCLAVLLVLVIYFSSLAIHEGVHWIQYSFDPNIKPVGFTILPSGYHLVNGNYTYNVSLFTTAVVLQPRYNMSSDQFFLYLNSGRPMNENIAYLIQYIFIFSFLFIVFFKVFDVMGLVGYKHIRR